MKTRSAGTSENVLCAVPCCRVRRPPCCSWPDAVVSEGGTAGRTRTTRRRATRPATGGIEGTAHITMWSHAGQSGEQSTLKSQVKEFNRSQRQVRVELVTLPEQRPYTDLVLSAAASGDPPDLLDFDGPNLYSYAWSGTLKPIDSCVPAKTPEGPAPLHP